MSKYLRKTAPQGQQCSGIQAHPGASEVRHTRPLAAGVGGGSEPWSSVTAGRDQGLALLRGCRVFGPDAGRPLRVTDDKQLEVQRA